MLHTKYLQKCHGHGHEHTEFATACRLLATSGTVIFQARCLHSNQPIAWKHKSLFIVYDLMNPQQLYNFTGVREENKRWWCVSKSFPMFSYSMQLITGKSNSRQLNLSLQVFTWYYVTYHHTECRNFQHGHRSKVAYQASLESARSHMDPEGTCPDETGQADNCMIPEDLVQTFNASRTQTYKWRN